MVVYPLVHVRNYSKQFAQMLGGSLSGLSLRSPIKQAISRSYSVISTDGDDDAQTSTEEVPTVSCIPTLVGASLDASGTCKCSTCQWIKQCHDPKN